MYSSERSCEKPRLREFQVVSKSNFHGLGSFNGLGKMIGDVKNIMSTCKVFAELVCEDELSISVAEYSPLSAGLSVAPMAWLCR